MKLSSLFRVVLLPLVALILLTACPAAGHYFDEYLGVNLLANSDFDTDLWVPDQNGTYLTFEAIDATDAAAVGVPEGMNASTPVYRLEIVNLMPNGDFEESSVAAGALDTTDSGWWWVDDASGSGTGAITETSPIDGARSLSFDLLPADALVFPLSSLGDAYVLPQSYYMRFAFLPADTISYSFGIHQSRTEVPPWDFLPSTVQIYQFPEDIPDVTSFFTSDTDADTFQVAGKDQNGTIDNVRVVPMTIHLALRAELPVADSSRPAGLDLVSGTYRFSLYVHRDPSTTPNRFHTSSVTIRMKNPQANVGVEEVYSDAATPSASWESWTLLTVTVHDTNIFPQEDPSTTVLGISIVPTDDVSTGGRDAGSILVAHPILEFLPDE